MPTCGNEYADYQRGSRMGMRRPKARRFKGSKAAKRAARIHRK